MFKFLRLGLSLSLILFLAAISVPLAAFSAPAPLSKTHKQKTQKPKAQKPVTPEPEAPKPVVQEPEIPKPVAPEPEAPKPVAQEPEAPKPGAQSIAQGMADLKEENLEEALDDFKRARAEAPDSSVAAYFLGVAFKRVQDYGEAQKNLSDAITLTPAVKEAVIELADVYYQLGDDEKAMEKILLIEREGMQSAQSDFIKGLTLLRMGKNRDAIDAFTKAKSADASYIQSANYQIAVASVREGKLGDAKEIFKEIIVRDPNADMAEFAKQYIDAITSREKAERELKLTADVQYQYDDNVLLKPGDSSAAADVTNEGDSSTVTMLRAEYAPRLSGPIGVKGQYSFYGNFHWKLASHDVTSHTLSLAPNYSMKTGTISAVMSYNYTMVDDYKYLQTYSLTPTYQFSVTRGQFATVFVKLQKKEQIRPALTHDEDRDSDEWAAGASWFMLLAENKGFFNLSYAYNHEDTDGVNWEYAGNKFGTALMYPLTDSIKVNLGGEAYLQDFEYKHTVFGKYRRDKTYTASSMLTYAVTTDIDAQAQYVHTRGDSNIAVYDYNKSVVSVGIEARY